MIKKILKKIGFVFLGIFGVLLLFLIIFNFPVKNKIEKADLGVTFSSRYSADIGLDWRANYTAILDELGVRKIRIPVYWDLVETERDQYNFADLDWQLEEAQKRKVEVILTIGQKVPRWPECFVPKWVEGDQERKKELIEFLKIVVKRYQNNEAVKYWQVENEPFLDFGVCPALDVDLLDQEIKTVKQIDSDREIVITDSGELSTWIPAAKRADVFGTTMYRNVYKEGWGYYVYPLGPRFFLIKKWLIETFINQHKSIVIELQGEPWVAGWTVHQPLEEQFKSMNEEKLVGNVLYAKKAGFDEIYIWGAEWWYWLKEKENRPILWETAQKLFIENSVEKLNSEASQQAEKIQETPSQEELQIIQAEQKENADPKEEKKELNSIEIEVPFISQAPLGVWDEKHEEACEEASLIMLNAFLENKKLDKNSGEAEIQKMIDFQIEKYGDYKDTSAEETVRLAGDFYGLENLEVIYDFEREAIKEYLAKGKPIIVSAAGRKLFNPYFTAPGPLYHNLILTGFNEKDEIIVNDPGTKRGQNYRYQLNVLYEAIHDFTGDKEEIEEGKKAMIVIN
ncbi:MAG: C39 family peptidase [Candidatus Moraniibacteriota bacterium]